MNILLIEPPFERFIGLRCEWYPIGITSIATMLTAKGFVAYVYNAEHDNSLQYINTEVYLSRYENYTRGLADAQHPIWREINEKIAQFKPAIVGISVKSVKIAAALKVSEICKNINRNIIVIAGGFHATARPEDLLKSDCVDVVVRGEGEETLLELAENVKNGIYDFKAIKGISYKNADGTISHTPERGLINPLDNIPFPRRELIFDYDKYTPEQLGWIMTSRGCPYDCAYCNSKTIWERKVRFSPLEKVIDEINYLKTTFNSIHINFMDDSFTVNRNRVLKLCSMLIENKTGITWACLTRADLIDDEIAVSMKKAGCIKVDIGIESGNKRMQQLINKGIKLEDVRKSSDILKKHGIFWTGFFMMGFPTETKEEILETLKFMKEVNPNWAYLNIFTPYPGSKFYDMVEGDKLFQQQNNINIYSHQSPNNCFSTNISRDEFKKVVKLMFKEFNRHNSSLRSLLRRAYSKKYHRNPKQFLKDAGKVLSWLRP